MVVREKKSGNPQIMIIQEEVATSMNLIQMQKILHQLFLERRKK